MKWFKTPDKYATCKQCFHMYEQENRLFMDYCRACAEPMLAKERTKQMVIDYAVAHIQELEGPAMEWDQKRVKAYADAVASKALPNSWLSPRPDPSK